jgi:hypothetical protein
MREAILAYAEDQPVATVRGVFYHLSSTLGIVEKDDTTGYRPVQKQLLAMRREGILRWDFIADATRWQRKPETFTSAEDALSSFVKTYRRDLWQDQGIRIEVWLEKDALAGLVVQETEAWDVPLMVSRGVSSETFLRSAAEAADEAWKTAGVGTHIFTLYDLDAGGARGVRSIENGLVRLSEESPSFRFRRLAVTKRQVEEWDLPTRPAKRTDPEAASHGSTAAELDAIPPDRLRSLVRDAIVGLIDPHRWNVQAAVEREEIEGLMQLLPASTNGAGR